MKYRSGFLFVGCLLASLSLFGQSKLSPNTQHQLKDLSTLQTRSGESDETMVRGYIYTKGTIDFAALEKIGVRVNLQLENILTAQLPLDRMSEIEALDFVAYIQTAIPVKPMLDKARAVTGVDKVHAGENLVTPYTGNGVVVGIVDSGFDYTHPNFFDSERQELRIKRVWEQKYAKGTPPEGFSYGSEFTTAEEILAIGGDVTTNTHGTHVAGIAAGGDRAEDNPYYGVAGDAEIVLVSMDTGAEDNVSISDAVAYIYNYAESMGKPCVINLSLGTQIGPHDGTALFDQVTDRLQGNGRLLVGSLGNFGNNRLHVSRTFSGADDASLQILTDYSVKPTTSAIGGAIDIWGEPGMEFDVKAVIVRESTGVVADETPVLSATVAEGASVEYEWAKSAGGSILMTSEVNPFNGKTHVLVTPKLSNLRAAHSLGFVITPRTSGTLHAWTDGGYIVFSEVELDGWTMGDKQYTLAEIGGTGKNIISVGAFTSGNTYKTVGSQAEKTTEETLGALASFSSVGPTIDGRMKPDITAPGTFIASSVSSHYNALSSLPLANAIVWNNQTYNYGYMQGTSMSAPFVTGVLATWLQANPRLTPDEVRDILSRTALTDEHTASSEVAWGYGKIDAYAGLKESLLLAAGVEESKLESSCLISRVSSDCLRLVFAEEEETVSLSLYDALGRSVKTERLVGVQAGEEIDFSLIDLPRGMYVFKVNTQSFKIIK